MRIPRIYHPELITAGREIALSDDAANHVGRVLRMGLAGNTAVRRL